MLSGPSVFAPSTPPVGGVPLGSIARLRCTPPPAAPSGPSVKALRFARKRVVNELRLSAGSRAKHCHRTPQQGRTSVEVRSFEVPNPRPGAPLRSLSYGGLQSCGSAWDCPLCAAKISERRRLELLAGVAAWQAMGGQVFLGTLTHGHNNGDRLADLLAAEQRALHRFVMRRSVRRLLRAVGYVGHVRAWEITHGRFAFDNGWHPHFHVLFFVMPPEGALFSVDAFHALREPFFAQWAECCERAGLQRPNSVRGFRIDAGDELMRGQYIAKMGLEEDRWNVSHEMTKGHVKKAGEGKGETPFDLLDAILRDGGDTQAMGLFREFSAATRGKHQLSWSRGLRDRLGLSGQASDEEVAAEVGEGTTVLLDLTLEQWRAVLRCKAEGQLLEVGEAEGLAGVVRVLSGCFG